MKNLERKTLTYHQRVVLFFYREFFSSDYLEDCKKYHDCDVNIAHIKMQKMIYILNVNGIGIGNYAFSWNFKGPYSLELMDFLKGVESIDTNSIEKDCWESLGLKVFENNVQLLIRKLKIRENNNDEDWIELISSIIYLSQVVFPGLCKDEILDELFVRKTQYKGREKLCDEAWKILSNEGLLTCIE